MPIFCQMEQPRAPTTNEVNTAHVTFDMVAWRPSSRSVANAESAKTNELPAAEAGGGPLLAQIGTIHPRTARSFLRERAFAATAEPHEHRLSIRPARHRRVDERTNSAPLRLSRRSAPMPNERAAHASLSPHLGSAVL